MAKEMLPKTLLALNNDIAPVELTNNFGQTILGYANHRLSIQDEDGA